MAKSPKSPAAYSRPHPPSNSPPASRRASAEWRLRILERLTCGLTVAHIAHVENLMVHRVRQIIAGMLGELYSLY